MEGCERQKRARAILREGRCEGTGDDKGKGIRGRQCTCLRTEVTNVVMGHACESPLRAGKGGQKLKCTKVQTGGCPNRASYDLECIKGTVWVEENLGRSGAGCEERTKSNEGRREIMFMGFRGQGKPWAGRQKAR